MQEEKQATQASLESERPPLDDKQILDEIKPGHRKRKKEWSFPTVSKCRRCGVTDTKAIRTDIVNGWQYRLCQRAICRHRYRVQGVRV